MAEYVFAWVGGLRPDGLGFRRAVIAPRPDVRLGHLNCRCRTASGLYESSWRIHEDGTLTVRLTVPFGCIAAVTLPFSGRETFELAAGSCEYHYQPNCDLLAPYGWDTRLSQLAGDEEAAAVLSVGPPQLLGLLQAGDQEFTTQTFRQLSTQFFMGLSPEKIAPVVERLSQIRRRPGEG